MSAQTATTLRRVDVARRGARRERRHLRPVHEGPRRHPLVFFLLYVLVGIGAVIGAVSFNALAAEDAVHLAELEEQVAEAERDYALLTADVATLEDPARIRQMAEQMGMRPTEQRYLVAEQPLPGDRAVASGDDPVKPVVSASR